MNASPDVLAGVWPVARRLLVRAAVVWAFFRPVAVLAVQAQSRTLGDADGTLGAGGVLGVALACTVLGAVDLWRRREQTLLGNLGFGRGALVALLAAPAVLGECVLGVVRALPP